MKLQIFNEKEINDLVYNELKKRDKVMNKTELKILIKTEITEQLKKVYGELFEIRKKLRSLKCKKK